MMNSVIHGFLNADHNFPECLGNLILDAFQNWIGFRWCDRCPRCKFPMEYIAVVLSNFKPVRLVQELQEANLLQDLLNLLLCRIGARYLAAASQRPDQSVCFCQYQKHSAAMNLDRMLEIDFDPGMSNSLLTKYTNKFHDFVMPTLIKNRNELGGIHIKWPTRLLAPSARRFSLRTPAQPCAITVSSNPFLPFSIIEREFLHCNPLPTKAITSLGGIVPASEGEEL